MVWMRMLGYLLSELCSPYYVVGLLLGEKL